MLNEIFGHRELSKEDEPENPFEEMSDERETVVEPEY